MKLVRLLIGRTLANREGESRKITAIEGVPAMGLDGLGSSAYGPEAALTILIPLGAAGLAQIGPIMIAILVLLIMLFLSYWQTIAAYPSNGGAYTVAKENLGEGAGLAAAAALMIDYVLNVAVGISAGIGALTSALPILHPYTLPLCLAVLVVVTLANLRGTREAGLVFSLPTYLFVASFAGILGYGIWVAILAGGHPTPVVAPPALPAAAEGVTLWLVLRAFSSGCTAMTGVEAVSNGVGAFREPTVTYAHRTLIAIVVILGGLLAGIAYLVPAYGVGAMDQTAPDYQSVLSQLVAAIIGRNFLYFVAIGSLLAILSLSANTSFVGFPRLCRLVAEDGYLPRSFAVPGRRLVFSVGILFLALAAAVLMVMFGGITDRLIPLFAVGAFLSFTMSQAGMAAHWYRRIGEGGRSADKLRLAVNGAGALVTAVSLVVILAAKFVEGAWITVIAIPCVLALVLIIKRYYRLVDRQLREDGPMAVEADAGPPIVLIPVRNWNRLVEKAVAFALRLSSDVVALHVTRLEGPEAEDRKDDLRRRWGDEVEAPIRAAGKTPPQLVQLASEYRSMAAPLLKYVAEIETRCPGRPIAVVIPELVKAHWWDYLLHTRRAFRLRTTLLRHGGANLAVITVPWTLEEPRPQRVIDEEEPRSPAPSSDTVAAR